MKEQTFIKPLAVGSKMMRLNMAEREPQNKQDVFGGLCEALSLGQATGNAFNTTRGAKLRSRRARKWKMECDRRY
jgi:hypothetical protein